MKDFDTGDNIRTTLSGEIPLGKTRVKGRPPVEEIDDIDMTWDEFYEAMSKRAITLCKFDSNPAPKPRPKPVNPPRATDAFVSYSKLFRLLSEAKNVKHLTKPDLHINTHKLNALGRLWSRLVKATPTSIKTALKAIVKALNPKVKRIRR